MNLKAQYSSYMHEQNVEGSGKATSCVRAMDLLGPILAKSKSDFSDCAAIWSVTSTSRVAALHKYILEQQKLAEKGIFKGEEPISYWRDGWCSAALKNYKEFLILRQYKDGLWQLYNEPKIDPAELGKRLAKKKIPSIEELASEHDMDFSTKEGKEVLRQTKARVNQDFFRDMILFDYGAQCCVTGLNVPGVLRASHIVAWKDDKGNRLNPANGLCLSATYDAAFDRHLISFDEDYRMIFSPQLKEYYANEAFKTQFLAFKGKQISKPKRFCPDQAFLEKHRNKIPA